MRWRILLSLILAATLAGCMPTQQQLAMERDLQEMKRRLADLERGTAALQQNRQGGQLQERIDLLARSQADQQAVLDAIRVELQTVSGRFEDQKRERTELREEVALVRDDLALKITALEDRLARLEAAMAARPAAAAAQPPAPEALYEQGVELVLKKGEYAKGRELLQGFLDRNPGSPLAVNAMYWIGESYYGEKKYENAILQFQDVIQKYGEHPKVAAALLKQGLAFAALGDQKNSQAILKRLVETFPLSEEAKKAKERLGQS